MLGVQGCDAYCWETDTKISRLKGMYEPGGMGTCTSFVVSWDQPCLPCTTEFSNNTFKKNKHPGAMPHALPIPCISLSVGLATTTACQQAETAGSPEHAARVRRVSEDTVTTLQGLSDNDN